MEERNFIPGAGFEPAPSLEGRDFKAHSMPLSSKELHDSLSGAVSDDVAGSRPVSAGAATDLATARGPLERACRTAGLPLEAGSLMYLEDLARKAFDRPTPFDITPKHILRAARLHRKMRDNPRRAVAVPTGMTVRQAKKQLMREHGLTSGRQWERWKKAQQRVMRAEVRHDAQ